MKIKKETIVLALFNLHKLILMPQMKQNIYETVYDYSLYIGGHCER